MRHQSNTDRNPAGGASGVLRRQTGGNAAPALLRRLFALAITSGALAASGGNAAHSQVLVDGQPDAVHIEARDVPLREVFDALQAKFNLRYRTNDLLDTRTTGIFDGPLRRVATRILDGYDFAMKITPQGIDVLILRQQGSGDKSIAAATPAGTIPKGSLAPVMTAAEANRYERGHGR